VTWTQVYDPLGHWWLSRSFAALTIIVLLGLTGGVKSAGTYLCASPAPGNSRHAQSSFSECARLVLKFLRLGFGIPKIVWIDYRAVVFL